jgi:hypothetical protein
MKYLSIFKDLFGSLECPIHHKNPEIIENPEGDLLVKCCCPKFHKECMFLIQKIFSMMSEK